MGRKPHIVIVDDDAIYLRVWDKIFRDIPDCKYDLVSNAKTALALIKKEPIDLLISDIVLGDQSGYDIAAASYRANAEVPIVLTTGFDCHVEKFDIPDLSCHVLYKPYRSIADIQRFIKHLLNRESVFDDTSEDSFSENEFLSTVTEWRL